MLHEMQEIILRKMTFNPCKARLNIRKLRTLELGVIWVFGCSLQTEVKKIILVKSSLCEVRFNSRDVGGGTLVQSIC